MHVEKSLISKVVLQAAKADTLRNYHQQVAEAPQAYQQRVRPNMIEILSV